MSPKTSSRKTRPFQRKHKFSKEDDETLKSLVKELGENSWRLVASRMPGRNPRQCRERWMNYANPDIKKRPWTPTEDALLQKKYEEMGPRWHPIAAFFPHRSCNQIKNRFSTIQRHLAKMTCVSDDFDSDYDNESEQITEDDIIEHPTPAYLEPNPYNFMEASFESNEIEWLSDPASPLQGFDFFTSAFMF